MKILSEQSGFTVAEALIATMVLSIGLLGVYTMQISAIHGNFRAIQMTTAVTAGEQLIEQIFAMDYDDADLTDADGDGAAGLQEDLDAADGTPPVICCQDGNDPLGNAVAGCDLPIEKADHCAVGPDNFLIYWNVSVDDPMPLTKRIVVNVETMDRGMRRYVELEYLKAQVVQ
jgi:hypothetical protein